MAKGKGIIVDVGDFSHDVYYPELQEEDNISEEEYYDKMAAQDAAYQKDREEQLEAERSARNLPTRSRDDEIVRGYEEELQIREGAEDSVHGCDPYFSQEDGWSK